MTEDLDDAATAWMGGLPVQKWSWVEEWWEDLKKPSRRRKYPLTPYYRHCLAIV